MQVEDSNYELEKSLQTKLISPDQSLSGQLQAHLGQVSILSAVTGEKLEQLRLHLKVPPNAYVEARLMLGRQPLRW
ncbi:Mitochondrial ribosome-associated GTPase 2 [Sciurus carolinensis]|uniref:Mitochondrial ribosome-associated GTPase 2 n=1 Tax=Sciurus carolinensis TaxID=30640 RepID=A0AA41MIK9_SCICA|nr:Mitochondrial ribosome-associated GTPase 2 [Sciurus carolinensis]